MGAEPVDLARGFGGLPFSGRLGVPLALHALATVVVAVPPCRRKHRRSGSQLDGPNRDHATPGE